MTPVAEIIVVHPSLETRHAWKSKDEDEEGGQYGEQEYEIIAVVRRMVTLVF
jgi:hypothetical protein